MAADAPPLRVPDTMAQRVLACTGCHGREGRASPQGYVPRIAGKPWRYLQRQLLAFRDGRRRNETMARLLENLDDEYLREIAAHFAQLDLPPEAPPRPAAVAPERLQRGEALARRGDKVRDLPACTACHGEAMTGLAPDLPGLLGLPRGYVVGQLGAWRQGTRRATAPDCMERIAVRLTTEDIAALADWLQAQPLPQPAAEPPRRPERWPLDCGSLGP